MIHDDSSSAKQEPGASMGLVSPCGRPFRSSLAADALDAIQAGVMRTRYKGRTFLKSPFDVVLYLRLLGCLRPGTVIEIGSKEGGSGLWFADNLAALGVDARIISIDLRPPVDLVDPRISFLAGDAARLGEVLDPALLASLPHPWLVMEDSAHTFSVSLAVLRFFDRHLVEGDYVVIEDGIVADMPGAHYERFENGPNRAVAAFLSERAGHYCIDAGLCDHFGHNVTYNPNGWLRRTGLPDQG